ncbi:MAG: hypothetical protein ACLGGX_03110 [Bdellovibrionia bacterium]
MKTVAALSGTYAQEIASLLKRKCDEANFDLQVQEFSVESIPTDFDLLLCDANFGAEHLPDYPVQSTQAGLLSCFDVIKKQGDHYIPDVFAFEALHKCLVKSGESLDIRFAAYIVVDTWTGVIASAVCAAIGFSEINIITHHRAQAEIWKKQLNRSFFSLQIRIIDADAFTSNSNPGSLLINTIDLKTDSDLAYFNFLRAQSLVVDLSANREESLLRKEADEAGLISLERQDVVDALVELVFAFLKEEPSV